MVPFASSCGDATVVCPDGFVLVDDTYCTDGPTACAEGTVEHNGECVSYDPNDNEAPSATADPPGSIALTSPSVVTITADEPATIYYTVDGTEPTTASLSGPSPVSVFDVPANGELKFLPVDLAGNDGEVSTELYGVDDTGPGTVTDLVASVEGGSIDVTWTNPDDEDFAGVLVIRSVVEPLFEPQRTEMYAPGNVGATEDILLVDDASQVTDDTPHAGFDRYTVWAYDELGNFGAPTFVVSSEAIPVPEQTGDISIDLSTGVVTVTNQPESFVISGTSEVDIGAGEIVVDLALESGVARPFFNTKLMVESINDGATAGDGTLATVPYVHYGVKAMATGESRTESFTITGVTGSADPVVLSVRIRDDPVLLHVTGSNIGGLGFADSSGVGATANTSCAPVAWQSPAGGFGGNRCILRDAVFSDDGRLIYAANAWSTELAVIDSSTFAVVAGADLHPSGGVGSVATVRRSPDGKFIYAVVTLNGHYRGGGSVQGSGSARVVDLVKLDASTLIEVGRLNLMSPGQTGTAMRELSISADGSVGATVSQSLRNVFFIDLDKMLLQSVTSTTVSSPSTIALEPDASHAWIGSRSSSTTIYRIDRTTLMQDEVVLPDAVSRPGQMVIGPDGVLYYGRKSPSSLTPGLTLIDTETLSVISTHYTQVAIKGITFSADGTTAFLNGRDLAGDTTFIATFDAITHAPIATMPAQGGGERSGHWAGISPF